MLENGVKGVIGAKAVHQCSADERSVVPKHNEMFIDIGAADKKEAEQCVSIGDAAYFDSEYVEFGDGFVKAKALDDRAGCQMILDMINSGPEYDFTACFLVQEEIGTRGAAAAAYTVAPDYAIVLECTTASDLPDTADQKKVCRLGNGAVVSYMDRGHGL